MAWGAAQRFALAAAGRGGALSKEQKKREAREATVDRADSHTSGARFVSGRYLSESQSDKCLLIRSSLSSET